MLSICKNIHTIAARDDTGKQFDRVHQCSTSAAARPRFPHATEVHIPYENFKFSKSMRPHIIKSVLKIFVSCFDNIMSHEMYHLCRFVCEYETARFWHILYELIRSVLS